MKNYNDDLSINRDRLYISGIWNIPELKDIFLGEKCCLLKFHHFVQAFHVLRLKSFD